jgi:hypothetical protein
MRWAHATLAIAGLNVGCGGEPHGDRADAARADAADLDAAIDGAAGLDAAIDAAADAATDGPWTGGTVAVTVYRRWNATLPVAGAHVLFMNAAGTLDARTLTGVDGRATGTVPLGGSLVVVDGSLLTSFLAVEDGDELTVTGTDEPPVATMPATVVVPDANLGATVYDLRSDCARGVAQATNLPVTVRDDCGPGPRDVLDKARSSNGFSTAYLPAPQVVIAPGATTTLPGPWQTPDTFTASYANVPPLMAVSVAHAPTDGATRLCTDADGLPLPVAGATSGVFEHAPPIGDGTWIETEVAHGAAGPYHFLTMWQVGRVTSVSIPDLAAELLPPASNLVASRQDASWTLGAGHAYDGVFVRLGAYDNGENTGTWRVVAPVGTTRVDLPTLPADLAGRWLPLTWIGHAVSLWDGPGGPGRDFRETVFAPLPSHPPLTARQMWIDAQIFL